MKRFIKKSFCLFLVILFAGCDKYLEETPDNRVDLNTPEKAAQLLTSAYCIATYSFTEWMSDNVAYTSGTEKRLEHNQSYSWEEVTSIEQDTPPTFWTYSYDAISHSNEVLAAIDNIPGDKARKDAIKGEAYLTRAYAHFMLVNHFAKHFDPQTANEDLGIPYVLEPETEFVKTYTRESVADVYEKIEDDLEEGLELVNGAFYANSGKFHFTKNAALAFASRFYLFRGDYDNCIKYSTEMLAIDPGGFVKDIDAVAAQSANPTDFIRTYTSPNDPSNLLLIRNVTNFPVSVGYWPTAALLDEIYGSNPWNGDDARRSNEFPLYVRGTNGLGFGKFEFLFERSSLTSNVGVYYTIAVPFRGEEVLLNRAESYVFKNQLNLALADLQIFANKRYSGVTPTLSLPLLRSFYGSTNNQFVTLSFILDEKRKEFIHEGLRWFDIRRYGISVQHRLENGSVITLEQDDLRKVLQIPQAAIDVGGLEPNPR